MRMSLDRRKGRLPQLFLRNHISGTQTFGSLGKGLAGIVIDTAFSFLVSAGAIIKALHRTAAAAAVHHATQKILMESQSLIFLGPLFKQVRPVLQKILDRIKGLPAHDRFMGVLYDIPIAFRPWPRAAEIGAAPFPLYHISSIDTVPDQSFDRGPVPRTTVLISLML